MISCFNRQCPTGTISYTVRAGDTLYPYCRQIQYHREAILAANPGIVPGKALHRPGDLRTLCTAATTCMPYRHVSL